MAGKGLRLQSLKTSTADAWVSRRAMSGALLHGAAAQRAGWHFASAPGVEPRQHAGGPDRHLGAALAATGLVALAAGLLVYLADREPSHATLIPAITALAGSNLFGVFGQWLPSFVHPFAFSLFTAATYPSCTPVRHRACVAWWAVNVAFEAAQYPAISLAIAETTEGVCGQSWPARLLANYALRGTFDLGDLIAATAGAVAAASVLCLAHRLEAKHAQ